MYGHETSGIYLVLCVNYAWMSMVKHKQLKKISFNLFVKTCRWKITLTKIVIYLIDLTSLEYKGVTNGHNGVIYNLQNIQHKDEKIFKIVFPCTLTS